VIAVEKFLAEVEAESPCGPNLEYDADFQAMELAARGRRAQELGERRIDAVPPAWPEVRKLATKLLARSKDIRLALYLARAELADDGVAGFGRGVDLMRAMLDRYWDAVHPQLDADDGDPTIRLNALAGLVDPDTTLPELRQALIVDVARKGRITVRDVLAASGKLQSPTGEAARPLAEIEGICASAATDRAEQLANARDAVRSVQALYKLLADKVGTDRALDLKPLCELLQPVADICARALGDTAEAPNGSGEPSEAPAVSVSTVVGEIRSRDDAVRVLDRVCEFMERTEPASPAPLLIRRAQRLMKKTFVEIIEDLTPDSLAAIKALAGIKDER
jgi:type VI secretion system protein ImpA